MDNNRLIPLTKIITGCLGKLVDAPPSFCGKGSGGLFKGCGADCARGPVGGGGRGVSESVSSAARRGVVGA
jgi:hypothetical protein